MSGWAPARAAASAAFCSSALVTASQPISTAKATMPTRKTIIKAAKGAMAPRRGPPGHARAFMTLPLLRIRGAWDTIVPQTWHNEQQEHLPWWQESFHDEIHEILRKEASF